MTIQSGNRRLLWIAAGLIGLATLTAGSAQAAGPQAISVAPTDSSEERLGERPIIRLILFDGSIRIYKSLVYEFNRTMDGRVDRPNRSGASHEVVRPPSPLPAPREPRAPGVRSGNADGRRPLGG